MSRFLSLRCVDYRRSVSPESRGSSPRSTQDARGVDSLLGSRTWVPETSMSLIHPPPRPKLRRNRYSEKRILIDLYPRRPPSRHDISLQSLHLMTPTPCLYYSKGLWGSRRGFRDPVKPCWCVCVSRVAHTRVGVGVGSPVRSIGPSSGPTVDRGDRSRLILPAVLREAQYRFGTVRVTGRTSVTTSSSSCKESSRPGTT